MRKTLVGIVSLILTVGLLAGCSGPGAPDGGAPTPPYGKEYVKEHLDPDYSIEYLLEQKYPARDGKEEYSVSILVSYTHTSYGGHYFSASRTVWSKDNKVVDDSFEDYLFIKNGDADMYDTYDGNFFDGFTLKARAAVDQKYVDEIIAPAIDTMTSYVGPMSEDPPGVLQGCEIFDDLLHFLSCDKYTKTFGDGTHGKWVIDKKTGVLRSYTYYGLERIDESAYMTKFNIGNVTLPKHD